MIVLAYILAILSWPIVTLASVGILQRLLMPVFTVLCRPPRTTPNAEGRDHPPETEVMRVVRAYEEAGFWLADVFLCATVVASQVAVVFAGKCIFALFGCEASRMLALPFGIWCLVGALMGSVGGRVGRHVGASMAIGLISGWAVGAFWLL